MIPIFAVVLTKRASAFAGVEFIQQLVCRKTIMNQFREMYSSGVMNFDRFSMGFPVDYAHGTVGPVILRLDF